MIKASAIAVVLVLAVSGCGNSSDYVTACGTTTDNPPIVRPMQECEDGFVGVRVWRAHKSQLEQDDLPVVGQPMDDDFYGSWWSFESPKTTTRKPAPVKPSKAPAAKAAAPRAASVRPVAPVAPRAVARPAPRPAPRISSPSVRTGR